MADLAEAFSSYRRECLLTASHAPSEDPRAFTLLHGAVGIVDELNELLDTFGLSTDELGDVWWYVALVSSGLGGIRFGSVPPARGAISLWSFAVR